jgi:TRAP-type C4-dicarboxylate transport system permease small subunit
MEEAKEGQGLHRLESILDWLPSVLLLAVACLTTLSVVCRALFSIPIPDEYDVVRLLLGVIFCWGIAGAFRSRSHIYLDIIANQLSSRNQAILERVGACLCLVLVGFVLITMGGKTIDTWKEGLVTIDFTLPLWVFYFTAWLGILAAFLVLLKQALFR